MGGNAERRVSSEGEKNGLSFVNIKPSTLGDYNLVIIAKDGKASEHLLWPRWTAHRM